MKKIITERDIREAAASTGLVLVKPETIVTPLAKDIAAQLKVRIEPDRSAPPEAPLPEDAPPVKTVAIASDHGGFALKQELIPYLRQLGYITHDLGPASNAACDYPDFAFKVAQAVADKKTDMGIMIDSVGIGSAMAANRVKGVLAAKCNNTFEARSAREHNYANLLTLGAKIIGSEMAKSIVKTFLETPGGAERHRRRVSKILDREA